jgi:hypothetical protein
LYEKRVTAQLAGVSGTGYRRGRFGKPQTRMSTLAISRTVPRVVAVIAVIDAVPGRFLRKLPLGIGLVGRSAVPRTG